MFKTYFIEIEMCEIVTYEFDLRHGSASMLIRHHLHISIEIIYKVEL